MSMKRTVLASVVTLGLALTFGLTSSLAESYQVCAEKYTDVSGNRSVSLTDCEGNNYRVRSGTVRSGSDRYHSGRGSRGQISQDGASYTREKWCDDSGCYRINNQRDMCVLEVTGELVDCY
ncbi:hypothetical protein [Budvicia aquatica]|uniref:Cyanovirin-N domain-containing protein n=1 Tax=Budvicia aquatica TaxID=82979 RepID=A0A2C6C1H6_9GAMM|nr:hypothetical protein [Budvicia aquatica]PHI30200.1 hypothetical protein CRN84_13050 [Budvicia aquatica]GKX53283.1 hypothetical protein SOASR029_35920 [Budvicia aquatica]VFS49247.1 Uncharacterised protein [Budvicia aquatica]